MCYEEKEIFSPWDLYPENKFTINCIPRKILKCEQWILLSTRWFHTTSRNVEYFNTNPWPTEYLEVFSGWCFIPPFYNHSAYVAWVEFVDCIFHECLFSMIILTVSIIPVETISRSSSSHCNTHGKREYTKTTLTALT